MRDAWAIYRTTSGTAKALGVTRGTIIGRSRILKLPKTHHNPKRITKISVAAATGHTNYPGKVFNPPGIGSGIDTVLKPGRNSAKLGERVTKGAWKGMPIFSLTLEERATCPRSCKQWLNCYGNNMQFAKRYRHGKELEGALSRDLYTLHRRYSKGFVIRLHVLGDFYSMTYIDRWEQWLVRYPGLRVFGYTAWPATDPRGARLAQLRDRYWDRFAIRTSGAKEGPRTTVFRDDMLAPLREPGAIVCPVQLGKTASCGTCALCWSTKKSIAFIEH